jgi:quinol monooxygenase YgiN
MTQSVIRFDLLPGRRDAFLDTFTRIGVLRASRAQPGFRVARLLVDADDPDAALVIAEWDSPASYQGWLDSPIREDIGERLRPYWVEDPEGRVFELVQEVRA